MNFVKIFYHLKVVFITFILAASIYLPASAYAAGPAVVSVSAPLQTISSGTQFTVNILVQPNNSIAGAQFNLSFNPSLATVNGIIEGNLLKQNGASTYFIPGQIDNNAGTISGVAGTIISPGQTVSSSGTFAVITFTSASTKGTCPLTLSTVIIGDKNGQTVTTNISNGQVSIDRPPVLSVIGNKSVNEGVLLSFTISSSDPDGDALTYSASNLPSGATFNPGYRTFSWTPNLTQAGSYPNIHFQVSDGSLTASEDITITVNNNNQIPTFNSIGNKSVNEGELLSFTVSANDPDGDTLTYSAFNLPSGSTFNSATRTFSWTPNFAQAGSYPDVRFQVSDGSLITSENITITVIQQYLEYDPTADGYINVLDMITIGQCWGQTGAAGWIRQDVNSDGNINVLDMIIIGQHWTG